MKALLSEGKVISYQQVTSRQSRDPLHRFTHSRFWSQVVGFQQGAIRHVSNGYNIVDMEVLKTATSKIEEHQREIVQAENNHRTDSQHQKRCR